MKIGDYVRTKYGKIGRISNLAVDYSSELILCEEDSIPFAKHQIIKHKEKLIDLIEKGDYVNGCKVLFIDKDLVGIKNVKCIDNTEERKTFYNEDIKSIVTKEQFESMEYRIGE